jgi:hypothetical protein
MRWRTSLVKPHNLLLDGWVVMAADFRSVRRSTAQG